MDPITKDSAYQCFFWGSEPGGLRQGGVTKSVCQIQGGYNPPDPQIQEGFTGASANPGGGYARGGLQISARNPGGVTNPKDCSGAHKSKEGLTNPKTLEGGGVTNLKLGLIIHKI